MTQPLVLGMSLLVGFGFSFLPGLAPFVAVLFGLSSRWRLGLTDIVWGLGALLLALPLALHGQLVQALGMAAEIAAAWALFHAFRKLHEPARSLLSPRLIAVGMLIGLASVVVLSARGIEALHFGTSPTIAQAIVWSSPPALVGHTVLTLGAAIAVISVTPGVRLASLALAAAGILISGSREAAIGWVLVAVVLLATAPRRSLGTRLLEIGVACVMVAVAAGLAPLLGWGRVGFLVEPGQANASANLLQGTEVPNGDWWDTSWVRVRSSRATLGGRSLAVYDVEKRGRDGWLRLQQSTTLQGSTTYTVSAWIRSDASGIPGIQGWGQYRVGEEPRAFILSATLRDGAWRASVSGPGTVLASGIADTAGDWRRVFVTFRYDGQDDNLPWYLGLAPDVRAGGGATAAFAGFQLEASDTLHDYVPGAADEGLDFGVARIPYWSTAIQGFLQRPLLGWGADTFASYYNERWPNGDRLHVTPAHAHNLVLQTAFEGGMLGLLGLLALLVALIVPAALRADLPLLATIGAVLLANMLDFTLFYSGVLYPLAALAGWRAADARTLDPSVRAQGRQSVVRMALAATDFAAAFAALLAARWLARVLGIGAGAPPLNSVLVYLLLLWPLMVWRERLYPGYGLTPAQELGRHVSGVTGATLVLAAASVPFGAALTTSPGELALLWLFSATFLPLGRAAAKRIMHGAGLWGRDAVILGAGETGTRLAAGLLRKPLDGLHPVAFFDDDPVLRGRSVYGIPVAGTLADVEAYVRRRAVRHAIVAIPSIPQAALRDLLDHSARSLERVQFVPDLAGLPAEDVYASSLDGRLAIEVRIGLISTGNRVFKRAIDLIGGGLLTLVLSPLLLGLYVWVRVDSRGSGFHRSERVGQNGRLFRCLKFRTMREDAEGSLGDLLKTDPKLSDQYRRFHKLDDDPRLTRAGRWLRRVSLDELPQLFNVLVGQMSLVGPRPYLASELPEIGTYGDMLFRAKPGMTGYWQVSGRNEVTFDERLAMEAHYIRNWTFWWDVILLAKTPEVVLRRRGAR